MGCFFPEGGWALSIRMVAVLFLERENATNTIEREISGIYSGYTTQKMPRDRRGKPFALIPLKYFTGKQQEFVLATAIDITIIIAYGHLNIIK